MTLELVHDGSDCHYITLFDGDIPVASWGAGGIREDYPHDGERVAGLADVASLEEAEEMALGIAGDEAEWLE